MSKLPEKEQLVIGEVALNERILVADLTRQSYSEFAGSVPNQSWLDYEDRTRKTLLNDNNVLRIVARLNNKIVGAVLFCQPYEMIEESIPVKNIYPEMRLLAVSTEFRNLGIGAKLIEECERLALVQDFITITLHTTMLMQTAKLMYERRGYIRYPDIDFEPTPGFVVWGYRRNFV